MDASRSTAKPPKTIRTNTPQSEAKGRISASPIAWPSSRFIALSLAERGGRGVLPATNLTTSMEAQVGQGCRRAIWATSVGGAVPVTGGVEQRGARDLVSRLLFGSL